MSEVLRLSPPERALVKLYRSFPVSMQLLWMVRFIDLWLAP